ncbi:MAG: hypothetical protein M3P26_01980 [Gemmatimonadota bacterium]|nr:hypothetical protein [Gemmatimonadota bacterium]
MTDSNRDKQPDIPTDSDELAADAQASEPGNSKKADPSDEVVDYHPEPNPSHTTTGKFFTAPKFGSAGSGGLEIEPGLDVD